MKQKEILVNSLQCLECNEIITSHHRHDYKTCSCSNKASIDGGKIYLKYSAADVSKIKLLTTYSDAPHKEIREVLHRGGRGINGTEPLKYVLFKDVDDEWLQAIIDYEELYRPDNIYLKHYKQEQEWRLNQL